MSEEFRKLTPFFIRKFFPGMVKKFDWQRWVKGRYKNLATKEKEIDYETQDRALVPSDIYKHFYENERDLGDKFYSSLSLSGLSDTGIVKVISIDIDDAEQMSIWVSKLQPQLVKDNIDYFIEWGGFEDDSGFTRCHVLIFLDSVEFLVAKSFTRVLFHKIGEPIFANDVLHFPTHDKVIMREVFPINKPNNRIRPPGGYHMRRSRRYPCEYDGRLLASPIEILEGIRDCRVVTKEFINNYIDPNVLVGLDSNKVKAKTSTKDTVFYFEPRTDLGLPHNGIPPKYGHMVKNCQAIHGILDAIVNHEALQTRGESHDPGLHICASLLWQDVKFKNTLGHDFFFNTLVQEYRDRSAEDHNWGHYGYDRAYVLRCESWDQYFGLCDGCPYRGKIENPSKLIPSSWSKPIKKILVDKVPLTTYDEIRAKEFPLVEDYLFEAITSDKSV